MPRVLYRGDYFPTLEDALVDGLARGKSKDPLAPVLVLCPTAMLREHLGHVVAARLGGLASLSILTLGAWARRLAATPLVLRGVSSAPSGAGEIVLSRAGREGVLDGTRLEGVARTAGFGAAALQTVRDLREADITAAMLRRSGREDLARLVRALEDAFAGAGWVDEAAIWSEATAAADASTPATVVLYGFYDLTERQWSLVRALCQGDRTVVACVPDGGVEAFRFAAPTLATLGRLGFVEATPPRPEPADPRTVAPALVRLRERLFEPPEPAEPVATDALRIVGSPGGARQAREVARAVLDAIRELDVPAREIAVLLRASEELVDPLVEALDGAGIPTDARTARAAQRPAHRGLRLLAELRATDMSRVALAELLTSDLLDPAALLGAEGTAGWAPFAWDALTRRLGIVRGAGDHRVRLGAHVAHLEERIRSDEGGAGRWGAELGRARALLRAVDVLARALAAWPERATLEMHADALVSCRSLLRVGLDAPPNDATVALRELSKVAGEVSLADVVRLLDRLGAEVLREPIRLGEGRVVVRELMAARGVPFDVVIVPNLAERVFPRPPASDPLLPDDERRALAAATQRPLAQKGRAIEEERTLFRLAVGAARRRLVLTYPRLDPSRETARAPSLYCFAALEALEGRPIGEGELERHPTVERVSLAFLHPRDPARILDGRERLLSELEAARATRDAPRAATALCRHPHARAALALDQGRWRTPRLTEWDGLLVSDEARAFGARSLAGAGLSASRLELWAACPFRFLLASVLGVERPEEPEERWVLDPLDRGNLVHRILQRFAEEVLLAVHARPALDQRARLRTIAAEELDREERLGAPGAALLWRAERRRIVLDLDEWLAREAVRPEALAPRSAEVAFGPPLGGPPVRLDTGGRVLPLLGRIDRVDVSDDGGEGLVVDYKTGRVPDGIDDDVLRGGRSLQLAVYIVAARVLFPEVRHWTAAYDFVTERAGFRRVRWDEGQGSERLADLSLAARSVADGVEQGLFPQDPGSCRSCDFTIACPVVDRIAPRKSADPRRAPFDRLRGIP